MSAVYEPDLSRATMAATSRCSATVDRQAVLAATGTGRASGFHARSCAVPVMLCVA